MRMQYYNMGQFEFLYTFGQFLIILAIFGHFLPQISNMSKILTRNTQNGSSICVTEVLKQNQCQSNPKSAPNNGFFMIFPENFS